MRGFRTGMSMIEIMIGVILLALIVVPSLNVIVSQTRTVTATRDHSQAAFVAQKVQEICRSYSFDMIEADQYSSDAATQQKTFEWKLKNSDELRKHVINGIEYTIDPASTMIDAVPDQFATGNPAPTVYLLKFSVVYTGKDKRSHRLDISTAVAQRE
ncbi:MAG: hypothetical protein PHD82_01415 [Candidatus Riflebacteria bacterium]|jgi:Tfp pilus assembly protein PilE|nr:hypothetical protein [Candidatus Riflebacteria bacterium]